MHPIAFHFGPFTIHWYGVLLFLGLVVGWWTTYRRARKSGFPPDRVSDMVPWIVLGGMVGARAAFVVMFWDEYFAGKPIWEVFMIHHGGLVFYGGVVGGVLGGLLFVKYRGLPVWRTADLLMPGVAIGYALGRIGCFLNGCCYGRACDLPWAVRFPSWHDTGGLPVHPTQLYETLWAVGAYVFLEIIYKKRRFDGQITGLFMIIYAVFRSCVEFFRGDYPSGKYIFGLTPAQALSIPLFLAGIAVLLLRSRKAGSVDEVRR